jgi:pyruvate dehydrogenase E1 component
VSVEKIELLRQLEKKIIWLSTYIVHNANVIRPKRDGIKVIDLVSLVNTWIVGLTADTRPLQFCHNMYLLLYLRLLQQVGGHQASSSSLATVLTALYLEHLLPHDRVAVKPHASPVFHAIQYLLGNQTQEKLEAFRAFGGMQSYPSKTKDTVEVDFSTGSVGLGAAATTFGAYMQDYLEGKGLSSPLASGKGRQGRFVALVGDAELDEGNVFEVLQESYKLGVRNNWWIVDYNRQSLDKVGHAEHFRLIERTFRAAKWEVITLKYGKELLKLFSSDGGGGGAGGGAGHGGKAIKKWFDAVDADTYSGLTFLGGAAFRKQVLKDLKGQPDSDVGAVKQVLDGYSDEQLHATLTNLGGHCMETVLEGFAFADQHYKDKNVTFIAYTVKGHGLPLAGHKDNHGLFLTAKQVGSLQASHHVEPGTEWDKFSGVPNPAGVHRVLDQCKFNEPARRGVSRDLSPYAPVAPVPDLLPFSSRGIGSMGGGGGGAAAAEASTQATFGFIMHELGKAKTPPKGEEGTAAAAAAAADPYGLSTLASCLLTTSPDVATSTNLSGFVNQRGVFGLPELGIDKSPNPAVAKVNVMSVNKWKQTPMGQHVPLGIAENNLFLLLGTAGMSAPLFGQRVLPVGTLYDPFIARGLDALNYGCYQDSRFMVVATPSGITLGPEGGAHQSINPPLICMGQPGMITYEPAFADELSCIMAHGFKYMQEPAGEGGSVCLRLSTRSLAQPDREMGPNLRAAVVAGAYWHDYDYDGNDGNGDGSSSSSNPSGPCLDDAKVVVVFSGAIAPEAFAAVAELEAHFKSSADGSADGSAVRLLQVTSPERLVNEWQANEATSHASALFEGLPASTRLVTVCDAHPASLSWLGSVHGHRTKGLGVSTFGQCGDLIDLYRHYRIDTQAIVEAAVESTRGLLK